MTNKEIKIIFLGGMSESGKSTAGIYFQKTLNYERLKIIKIEKELMDYFQIDYSGNKENFSNALEKLYQQENIYELFLEKILIYSNGKNVTLESLYRSEIFTNITNLHKKTYCFYFEANKNLRMLREFVKVNLENPMPHCRFVNHFEIKESFKRKHNAHLVKEFATHIINNDDSKENFYSKLKDIEKSLN